MSSFTDKELIKLNTLVTGCLNDAAHHLSLMLGKDISVANPDLSAFEVTKIPLIFGGTRQIVSAVYIGYHGVNLPENTVHSYDGHLLLTFSIESAYELAAILSEGLNVPVDKISGMTDSIFSEVGNVFGTSFISAMANALNVRIMPNVPLVINYRSSAILEYVQSKMKRTDGVVLLIKTKLFANERSIEGTFLLIPEEHSSLLSAPSL